MRLLIAPRAHRHGRLIGAVRTLALAALAAWSLVAVTAANASTPADAGSMTVAPGSATAGSSANAFAFTYAAPAGSRTQALLVMTFPAGFTWPQIRDTKGPGYVAFPASRCRAVGPAVVRLGKSSFVLASIDCPSGATLTLTYAGGGTKVTVPSAAGTYPFTTDVVLGNPFRVVKLQPTPSIVIGSSNTDTTPPQLGFVSPADGARLPTSSVTVLVDASDASGIHDVAIDGAPAALVGRHYQSTVALSPGANTIVAVATDGAGNTTTSSIGVHSNVVAPGLAITSPADGTLTASATTAVMGTASAADPADTHLSVTVDGHAATVTGGTFAATVPLAEGGNTIDVVATDGYGLTSTRHVPVVRDSVPPVISVAGVSDGEYSAAAAVTPSFGATDAHLATVSATLDGSRFVSGSPVSAEGTHVLHVSATDTPGNASSATVTFTLDRTTPTIDLDAPAEGSYRRDPATISFDAADANPATVSATLDGAAFTNGGTVTEEGTHVVHVTAADRAGNHASVTRTFTIDRTAPELSVASPRDGALVAGSSVTVFGDVSDISPVDVTVNGAPAPVGGGTFSAIVGLVDGENTITVVATDAAGNSSTVTLTVFH